MSTIIPLEKEECFALNDWAMLHPICKTRLFHIANEGKTSYHYGKELKRMGKKPGVSDYFLAYPCNGYSGLWIEMKRNKKYSPSEIKCWDHQLEFLKSNIQVGYSGSFAFGAEEAINIIKDYLKGNVICLRLTPLMPLQLNKKAA